MKLVTWNVNGMRAILKKDFLEIIKKLNADIYSFQETKLQKNQIPVEIILGNKDISKKEYEAQFKIKNNYSSCWYSAVKKGYSGTACFMKKDSYDVMFGIGDNEIDSEGRNITIDAGDFYLVNAYVPNAQPELKRLDFRENYENKLLKYIKKLDKKKPVIYCGDLNVAHNEIDLKNPDTNHNNPGFSDEERNMMTKLLSNGFVDVYREMYPTKKEYTWWSYRQNARENNVGWRIDYFIISERFFVNVKDIIIHNEVYGSDHCPVELILK